MVACKSRVQGAVCREHRLDQVAVYGRRPRGQQIDAGWQWGWRDNGTRELWSRSSGDQVGRVEGRGICCFLVGFEFRPGLSFILCSHLERETTVVLLNLHSERAMTTAIYLFISCS